MNRTHLALLALTLVALPAGATESPFETLEAKSALTDVQASQGVVFVDLYADW